MKNNLKINIIEKEVLPTATTTNHDRRFEMDIHIVGTLSSIAWLKKKLVGTPLDIK